MCFESIPIPGESGCYSQCRPYLLILINVLFCHHVSALQEFHIPNCKPLKIVDYNKYADTTLSVRVNGIALIIKSKILLNPTLPLKWCFALAVDEKTNKYMYIQC